MMFIRICAFVLILATVPLVHNHPIHADLSAVNTFLSNLAASDHRTDALTTLDYQNMASKANPSHDNAKNNLFSQVDQSVNENASYVVIGNLLPYFNLDSDVAIPTSSDFISHVNDFLDNFLASDAVKEAWNFLQAQGVSSSDPAEFRAQLYNLWFAPYARSQVLGSCGFKSVFFGEATGKTITRFANWYGFYLQEASKTFNYHGWFKKVNKIVIDLQFVSGADEDLETAFLLNSSPTFEFAAYTVAALTQTQPIVQIQGEEIGIQAPTLTDANGATVLDKVVISFGSSGKSTTKHPASGTTKHADNALQDLVDNMWNKDQDRPSAAQVTMNWGTHINGKSGSKQANLFTSVDESLFNKTQYADLINTYDKQLFTADVCKAEASMTGFKKQYLLQVFNTFTATPMFALAFDYLKSINYKETSSLENFKTNVLWPLWFGTYTRCKGPLGSSGWEHVFSGEIKSNEVDGQHDWVRYYIEQTGDRMVYEGYYTHDENLIGTFQYKWNGSTKPKGGFFTGTSPAFDFSIFTVCALAHGNGGNCHFKVTNYPITVTSYLQDCGDGSGTCLSTSYPSG